MIRFVTLFSLCLASVNAQQDQAAEVNSDASTLSSDYYSTAYKLSGTALRLALRNIIKGHTVVSYSSLYTHYQQTDSKPNNKVWDMYSDVPGGTATYEYTHGSKQCGNYSGEGDCYNREHSWPQSWFSSASTPSSDLFHVYPTDGYVNNRRSNFPFGKVGTATWTSKNGSKVGSSVSPGFTGTVFEPIDAYKGDFARSQFYMSVRYYLEDGNWSTSNGTNKSDLLPWYGAQMFQWHLADTVSTKEINRNNAVFVIQKNRNPFIDHPEFAAEIWNTAAAPRVVSVKHIAASALEIDLSRYIDSASAVLKSNYSLDQATSNPSSIQWGVENDVSKLRLIFPDMQPGKNYSLLIKNLKSINNIPMADTMLFFVSGGSTGLIEKKINPAHFELKQNYPNPFNPSTLISYEIPADGQVSLIVYDIMGREIEQLVHERRTAGKHAVSFSAGNYSSGVYLYRLQSGRLAQSRLMMLLK